MDYCTLFPEGWWSHCCAAHDAAYDLQLSRLIADTDLLQCVVGSAGSTTLAGISGLVGGIMYLGVRIFGNYFYKRSKKRLPS